MCSSETPDKTATEKPTINGDTVSWENYSEGPKDKEKCTPGITHVEFLNGDDQIVGNDGKQYVNLPREDKWVDGSIEGGSLDRLGQKPRILVLFDHPGKHTFYVKLEKVEGPDYSTDEKKRNGSFKYTDEWKKYTTDKTGSKIIKDCSVYAGGTGKFQARANTRKHDSGATTSNGKIETQRVIYFQKIQMSGDKVNPPANLDGLSSEFEKHGIKLIDVSAVPTVTIENMRNITTKAHTGSLRQKVNGAIPAAAKDKKPHMITILFAEDLPKKNKNEFKKFVEAQAVDVELTLKKLDNDSDEEEERPRPLWKNLYDGEWFVSAKFSGTDIQKDSFTENYIADNHSYFDRVAIDVTNLNKPGTIRLTANWAQFRFGIQIDTPTAAGPDRIPLIVVATQKNWVVQPEAMQVKTIIHEFGHLIGMVCNPKVGKETYVTPDKIVTWYNNIHNGFHCKSGIDNDDKIGKKAGVDEATCVMYGGGTNTRQAFCADCAVAVKKMDLSEGWEKSI